MASSGGMISALCWVPKGAASAVPRAAPISEEELKAMRAEAQHLAAGVLGEEEEEDSEEEWETDDSDDEEMDEAAAVAKAKAAAAALAAAAKGAGASGSGGGKKV
jgi:hypothetical protein